jgi:hypothetical protein
MKLHIAFHVQKKYPYSSNKFYQSIIEKSPKLQRMYEMDFLSDIPKFLQ